ncbi:MAG: hypothetical protein ACE37F_29615 [Nannocystaceae bacterium]|nr:hypothetical protein [bacterium]
MSTSPSSQHSLELSPTATVGLLVLFAGSGGLGYLWAGIGGAFFAGLGITTIAAVGGFMRKLNAQDRTRIIESAPNLTGLPPAQALSVMGAMTGTDGALSFKSELLTTLETIDETLEDDPDGALQALSPLLASHPRSPAVHLRRARAQRARGDAEADTVATALQTALDGGMNPLAATTFVEFESVREDLPLEDRHLRILAKALAQRGHTDHAAWCESRLR